MRPLYSPVKDIKIYNKYDNLSLIVLPYVSIIIGIIGTLSFAYVLKYFNFNN